jgi:hypothetical protein
MAYTIQHTAISDRPFWYHLETWDEGHREQAMRRANQYALDHGGYVCVKDSAGNVVFGTDPIQLDRAIIAGTNRDFPKERARRMGCCVS